MTDHQPAWSATLNGLAEDLLEDFVADLVDVREAIADLRETERQLVSDIHQLAQRREYDTQHGRVTVAKRRNRKWDHDEVVRHLTRVALDARTVDPETGELSTRPTWEIVADAITDCAGIGYWRIGKLSEYGLDADEFAEITSEVNSVTIR